MLKIVQKQANRELTKLMKNNPNSQNIDSENIATSCNQ